MTVVLRVENLNKAFGGIVVADQVNIEIAKGEILGLIGPNGAGKTSLFNLISGVLKPDSGHIYLNGSRIVHGPYGRAITAMRDEELAFSALGRNAMIIKVVVFAIGCGIAGIAGGLYAFYFQYVSPDQFEVLHSAAMLTMVVLGGMGTTMGPVVGAVVLIAIPQAITFLNLPPNVMAPMQGIIFTTLVMLFLFLRPAGLVGALSKDRMAGRTATEKSSAGAAE